jgi:3-dehydroquinate dehydratase-2
MSMTHSLAPGPRLVAVLNGPNLNMLGLREPQLYGSATLDDVEALCAETAEELGLAIDFRQTNAEGELISWVQECRLPRGTGSGPASRVASGIIINAAGYTHTSVALMDALLATDLPVIEVHITNIHRREAFRHHSYVSLAAVGVICGFGIRGYALALEAMADLLEDQQ